MANEAKLVDLLRQDGKASISLVALSGSQVVDHILFSPIDLVPNQMGLRGLGETSRSLPAFHRKSIGSKLIIEGLEVCRQKGYDFSVVLGDPKYYSRFGFLRANDYYLKNEYNVYDDFLVVEQQKVILKHVSGLVK
jgi:putative acetyltransferase